MEDDEGERDQNGRALRVERTLRQNHGPIDTLGTDTHEIRVSLVKIVLDW